MVVTAIEQQKNDKSKFSIFIDGEFAFGLYAEDVLYFKLKENEIIPQEKYDFIMENLIYIKAQDTALKFLSYKSRTQKEIELKLKEKNYSENVIEKVIAFLKKYDYINDEKYCRLYISQESRLKHKSIFVMKMELIQKGIDEAIVSSVINDTDVDEIYHAKTLILKKVKDFSLLTDKKRQSVYSMLARKGYSYDIIKQAFNEAKDESIWED